jgi:hypothetical protein
VPQPTYPGKVYWASGDHTAVTINQSGVFISKWNEYPLMQYAWNDSPYGTNNLEYYKRTPPTPPTVSGPTHFNTTGTFTIHNVPPGATVTLHSTLPASISGNTITVSNTYGYDPAFGTLSATVSVGGYSSHTNYVEYIFGEYVPEFIIGYHRVYRPSYSENSGWCTTGEGMNFLTDEGLQMLAEMQLQVRVLDENGSVIYTDPGVLDVLYQSQILCSGGWSYCVLQVRNITYNPNSEWQTINDYIYGESCPEPSRSVVYPNPASGIFTVDLEQTNGSAPPQSATVSAGKQRQQEKN